MSLDAFGRLRTSECFTTFSYYPSLLTNNSSLDIDAWVTVKGGTGSATYNSSNYINMQVSATNDYVVRKTKQPMEYQPGKSRLIYITGTMLGEDIGADTITTRLGLFNTDSSTPPLVTEGIYFQTDGTNLQWCETTQLSTTIVNQSSWNIDIFDGNGPSGKTLTTSDLQIALLFVIDQEWLGVGRVRVGFCIEGIIYYAHAFNHSLSVQYTKTPRQRITYQINGTTVTSTHTMRQMCSTAISESGYFPLCPRVAISTTSNGVTMKVAGTKYILLALKLQSIYTDGLIKLLGSITSYHGKNGKTGFYEIQLHSTNGSIGSINGTMPTYTNISNSISQYSVGDGSQTINTDGFVLSSGFVTTNSNAIIVRTPNDTLLTRTICTEYDTFYLVASGNSSDDKMFGTLEFIESI
jgi:hypothetical protein